MPGSSRASRWLTTSRTPSGVSSPASEPASSAPGRAAPASTSSRHSSVRRNAFPPVSSKIDSASAGRPVEAASADLADEVLDVVGREAREPHSGDLLVPAQVDQRVAELLRHVGLGVAERRDDEQAGVGGGPPEVAQEQERRMVGPVPVLEDEQDGRMPAGRDQELDDRRVQPVALRVLVGRDGVGEVADTGGEVRQQPLELAAARPEVGAEAGRIDRASQPVERLGERPVRRRHDGVAGPVEDERAAGRGLVGELAHQPALPRAGLAGDERDPPALAGRPRHERAQRRKLARAAHERERGRQPKRPRKGRLGGRVSH